jgi:NTP pyrophosphatase (non-canonical NTP hydrolase)
MVPERGGESQRLVRETMIAAGGYWRPLAAVARLLEELGELLELLDGEATPELGGELADLWIITTALADQFLAEVPEPGAGAREEGEASGERLVVAAGPIARVVNHYDGPKVPREGVPMPSLRESIAEFHRVLGALAMTLGVDLGDAVRAKLAAIHRRGDIERFARDGFDPSTAPVLATLAGNPSAVALPARLWGAPELLSTDSPAEWARAISGTLEMFAKAARAEHLEGYAIWFPPGPDRLGSLVSALDSGATAGEEQAFRLAGTDLVATALPAGGLGPIALVRPAP